MTKSRSPAPALVASDLARVRLLADPLRLRIVEALQERPATAKQVALAIGEKPSRIYHHVELLERAGLLRLVETRRKRGTVERYLAAAAGIASLEDLEGGALARVSLRLTAERHAIVRAKLRTFLDEAVAASEPTGGTAYHLVVGFYSVDER